MVQQRRDVARSAYRRRFDRDAFDRWVEGHQVVVGIALSALIAPVMYAIGYFATIAVASWLTS